MQKYVYMFHEGSQSMRELLGGKGANLAEMTKMGLPVPKGFTVTTETCNAYYEQAKTLTAEMKSQILSSVEKLESETGKNFGSQENPLLLSVRSGARASMPGMMDTILNLGLNDEVAISLSQKTNERFVYDSYRRLIQMYSDVVKGVSKDNYERYLDGYKKQKGYTSDLDLTAEDLKELTTEFKKIYQSLVKEDFPVDVKTQLLEAVKAVFESWNNERAIYYRKLNHIPDSWGTAVNVQEMVYGNMGKNSGTGVAFTRNPATGENVLYGEYLMNAQGEDVVAGVRTPHSIEKLKEEMPFIYTEFYKYAKMLETHYQDMQDMEFTIENGKLYMLQTRSGKRTTPAAIKIAVDMVSEGLISKEDALLRVNPSDLNNLLHKTFDPLTLQSATKIAHGLAASPGAASGGIYFHAKDAIKAHQNGENVILVRLETSPEDIEGMNHSEGVLTVRGGMTSHAAVVARGMGVCCITGCADLEIDEEKKTLTTKDGHVYHEKDPISLDGSTGIVYDGSISKTEPNISGEFATFMNWADEIRHLQIRVNADNKHDAETALKFGAEGIGLCRTEHMFFQNDRILHFRKMILATAEEERKRYLDEILPYQKEDFKALFEVMSPRAVVIRLLDPPLHEFLPKEEKEKKILAKELQISLEQLETRISTLKEFNPMMGHRGCRLAITYPEIAVMQTKAIITAALEVAQENIQVHPEIMLPLVGDEHELLYLKNIITETISNLFAEANMTIPYKIGTMIELPRACVKADKIAKEAEFFSFGTNDLTQMTYGFSRDDAGKFLTDYYAKHIFTQDPFARVDESGVGSLMQIAIEKAKQARPDIELGVCGEHGGEEHSIAFFHKIGLDYVSCSPYRVPVARLAAAKAVIEEQKNFKSNRK